MVGLELVLAELKALREEVRLLREKISSPAAGLLTVDQTAQRLGVGRTTVFALIAEGKLRRGPQLGNKTMVTTASVEVLEAPGVPQGRPKVSPPSLPRPYDAEREQEAIKALQVSIKTSRNTPGGRGRGRREDAIPRTLPNGDNMESSSHHEALAVNACADATLTRPKG